MKLKQLFTVNLYGSAKFKKLYHKYHASNNRIYRFLLNRQRMKLMRRYAADIPFAAKIGKNVTFPHGISGVFISMSAEVGEDCVIFHQVTIGSNTLPGSKRFGAPVIGKNVYIGAGAKIIGKVHVGDGARIGANCVVTQDVPANATVVLPHPRVICHDSPLDNHFTPWTDCKF